MLEKRCGLGFSCALMMQQSGLQVEDCPNLETCGVAQRLEPDSSWLSVAAAADRPRLPIIYGTTRSGKSVLASAILSAMLTGEESLNQTRPEL